MEVKQFIAGMVSTNCYFLTNEKTNETIIVDPGDNGKELAAQIKEFRLIPVAIILTHGHCDHTEGIEEFRKTLSEYDIPVYALDKEKEMLESPKLNQSAFMGYGGKTYPADEYFTDGQLATIGGLTFKVIATPGHTPGGCCYYFESDKLLFSGDTLFAQSIGRTDFPGGDMQAILDSIRQKLFVLPDDTVVLPGHNNHTTIEIEKNTNPFLV